MPTVGKVDKTGYKVRDAVKSSRSAAAARLLAKRMGK